MDTKTEIDAANWFKVEVVAWGRIWIQAPPRVAMTKEEALMLAAWLVNIAEPGAKVTFQEALEATRNT